MTEEMFELVDRDLVQSQRVNPSRQIKTRRLSFENIYKKFTQFRIGILSKKLDKKVEKALTQNYTEGNFERKITKNAEVIARLEEKIKVLSKEDVPTDYVAKRAIKLRKSMIDNLSYNSGLFYSIGMEHYDDVMATEELSHEEAVKEEPAKEESLVVEEDSKKVEETQKDDNIDVVQDAVNRQAIVDAVNSSFDDVKNNEDVPVITSEEVKEVINNSLDEKEEEPVIDVETVRNAVNEAFNRMETEKVESTVDVNDSVDKEIERIRVSRNNSKSVNSDQFDENGNRIRHKKYDYVPMTDEEIRQSQIKLGFDEHGNLINNGKVNTDAATATVVDTPIIVSHEDGEELSNDVPVRDIPVVVPEREEKALNIDLEDGNNMFEIIEQEENTPVIKENEGIKDSSTMTIDDYAALKEKILYLKQQKEESQRKKTEAQRRVEESAAREQEARKMFELSQASYEERMRKLREYAASLEADCRQNEMEAAEAEKKSKENEDSAMAQKNKVDETNEIIGEIDKMIGETIGDEPITALRVL